MNKGEILDVSMLKPGAEILHDISEYGVDEIIKLILKDNSILEKIPAIKWLMAGVKMYSSIQTAVFLKKYSVFINTMEQNATSEDVETLLGEMSKDKNTLHKIIENIIIDIDRYHTDQKAKLLGVLFLKTFLDHVFTIDEYNKLRFSIDLLHPFDGIICLEGYYNISKKIMNEKDEKLRKKYDSDRVNLDFSPLATSGLLALPKGGAYLGNSGGASINNLGIKFYENVIMVANKP